MVLLGAYHTPNTPQNASFSNNSDTIFYSIMSNKANKKQKFGKNSNNVTLIYHQILSSQLPNHRHKRPKSIKSLPFLSFYRLFVQNWNNFCLQIFKTLAIS